MRQRIRPEEVSFLRLALALGLAGWIAVVLAELGRLRPASWLVALAVAGGLWAALGAAVRRSGEPEDAARASRQRDEAASRRTGPASLAGLGLVMLVAGVAFMPPFESVLWASDATVYMAFGRRVAATGSLLFEDELLAELSVEARGALFHNPEPLDVTGPYARFPGGFLIPDVERPEVTAGFAPLYPAFLAVAWAGLGLRGAQYVAPLFAVLSVAAVFLLGRRLGGEVAALLAGLLTALSLPQIWLARLSMSEVVGEFFVLSGLLALLASRASPRLAAAGGALFGVAMLAKTDHIAVLTITVLGYAAMALGSASALRRRVAYFAVPFSLLLAHSLVHALAMPSHYLPFVRAKVEAMTSPAVDVARNPAVGPTVGVWPTAPVGLLVITGAAVLAGIGWLWRESSSAGRHPRFAHRDAGLKHRPVSSSAPRRATAPWGGAALLAMIAVYGVAYVATGNNQLPDTLPWLGWYLSWPVVAIFLLSSGFQLVGRHPLRSTVVEPSRVGNGAGDEPRTVPGAERVEAAFVLILVAVAAFHYLLDPQEPVIHIWSVRRLVPAVLPGVLLVVGTGVAVLADRLPRRRRWAVVGPIAALLVVLVGAPSLAIVGPGAGAPPWQGAIEQVDRLAAGLPPGAIVVVDAALAGTHVATALGYLHDVGAFVVQPTHDPAGLEDAVLDWLKSGRPVVFLLGDADFHVAAPRLALAPLGVQEIALRVLEETTARPPRELIEQRRRLRLFAATSSPAKRSVDVGVVAEDALFAMRGFHGPERDGRGAYRWTGPTASIDLVGVGAKVRLVVAGERPPGAAPARIAILLDGQRLVEELVVADAPAAIVVDAPPHASGDVLTLTIVSNPFRPRLAGLPDDDRQLGIKVYRIDY